MRESLRLNHVHGSFALAKITVLSNDCSKLYLTLHQFSKKIVPDELLNQYDISKARMIIGSIESFGITFVKSVNALCEDLVMECG